MKNFVVIAAGRSGSTLLVNYLNSHADVLCHHEPFNQHGWHPDIRGYASSLDALNHITNKGLKIPVSKRFMSTLRSLLNLSGNKLIQPWKFLKTTTISGFKITWGQSVPMIQEMKQWLEENKETKVIFLSREDLLARYVSYVAAEKTGVWHANEGISSSFSFDLDIEKYRSFLKGVHIESELLKKMLDAVGNELIMVSYEELKSSPLETTNKIFNFIGVSELKSLETVTSKRINQPLDRIIRNYNELVREGLV